MHKNMVLLLCMNSYVKITTHFQEKCTFNIEKVVLIIYFHRLTLLVYFNNTNI